MAGVEGSLPDFEVLGSLRVWVDGRERAVSRPAVRRLLGALLLTPGRLARPMSALLMEVERVWCKARPSAGHAVNAA